MSAISVAYNFGEQLDLKKLKKIKDINLKSLSGDENFLYTTIGPLLVLIFKNGKIRIIHEDRNVNSLKKEIPLRAIELKNLISKIVKTINTEKKNEDEILSKLMEGEEVEGVDEKIIEERSTLKNFVDSKVIRYLFISSEQVMGDYHRERFATQAGENLGRKTATGIKKKDELEEIIISTLKKLGLGIASLVEGEKEKTGRIPYAVYRVFESIFSYGTVPNGKPACHFIRGFIRGAYCTFLNQENINVVEVRCWRAGDIFCEFKVYII